jgi:hypothetical protein
MKPTSGDISPIEARSLWTCSVTSQDIHKKSGREQRSNRAPSQVAGPKRQRAGGTKHRLAH